MSYPNTITMDNETKEVVVRDLGGYFKYVVMDNTVLVDQNYLDELFSQELYLV